MLLQDLLLAMAGVFAALALGAMLFFGAVVAPTVFRVLPAEQGGAFLRRLFPTYYIVLAGVTGLAAALALAAPLTGGADPAGWTRLWLLPAILALCCAGFVFARQWLTPRINASRDAALAGDGAASARFDRLHKASVRLNGAQAAALLVAVAWPFFA
jgi:hypothetical protein